MKGLEGQVQERCPLSGISGFSLGPAYNSKEQKEVSALKLLYTHWLRGRDRPKEKCLADTGVLAMSGK